MRMAKPKAPTPSFAIKGKPTGGGRVGPGQVKGKPHAGGKRGR
jgi:hypothetical protein